MGGCSLRVHGLRKVLAGGSERKSDVTRVVWSAHVMEVLVRTASVVQGDVPGFSHAHCA